MNDVSLVTVVRSVTLREALSILDRTGAGMLLMVDDKGVLERTLTDGDLRRLILGGTSLDDTLKSIPQKQSHVIPETASRREALDLMDKHGINHLPVVDAAGKVVAILDRKVVGKQILLSTPHMGDTEREYVDEAFRTNWIAPLGPNVDAFENELSSKVGVGYAAALSSGTAAIHLGLLLLGVGKGDRVFCSTLTFSASVNPVVYLGAEPVFIDSDDESWNMSPSALERAFETARCEGWMPKAVVVVNLYGQSANMDPIMALCDHYGVPILEDAAESLGARYKGRASGSLGRVGVYSFNGNKIITTSGGGMLVSNDPELVKRARFYSTQARDPAPHYEHSVIGYNYRMSNILAGVGRGQLKVLDDRVKARRAVFEAYRDGLEDVPEIVWMPEPSWSCSNRWLSVCTIDPSAGISSAELIRRLAGEMIETRPVWKPMHLQPVFAGARYFQSGGESVSDRLFERGVCLPSGSNMKPDQIDRVLSAIRKVFCRDKSTHAMA